MTDTNNPFAAFQPAVPPPMFEGETAKPAAEPATNGRKRRGPKKTPADVDVPVAPAAAAAPAEPAKKRGRPKKEEGAAPKAARATAANTRTGTKIDLGVAVAAFAGLSEDESTMVIAAVRSLSALPKGSRTKIVAALGKVFA